MTLNISWWLLFSSRVIPDLWTVTAVAKTWPPIAKPFSVASCESFTVLCQCADSYLKDCSRISKQTKAWKLNLATSVIDKMKVASLKVAVRAFRSGSKSFQVFSNGFAAQTGRSRSFVPSSFNNKSFRLQLWIMLKFCDTDWCLHRNKK